MTIAAVKPPEASRPVLWFAVAALSGFALPPTMAALVAVLVYFPIGSVLGDIVDMDYMATILGVIFVLLAIASGVLFAGIINALFARRWWPAILAVLFGVGLCLGFVPGLSVGASIRSWGLKDFVDRSTVVIDAIERYSHATGKPPGSLADLMPTYLAAFPKTGMALYPDYEYVVLSGPCSINSKWHLSVDVNEFIDMNRLLYCPAQDHDPTPKHVLSRTAIGAWVHDRIDF